MSERENNLSRVKMLDFSLSIVKITFLETQVPSRLLAESLVYSVIRGACRVRFGVFVGMPPPGRRPVCRNGLCDMELRQTFPRAIGPRQRRRAGWLFSE